MSRVGAAALAGAIAAAAWLAPATTAAAATIRTLSPQGEAGPARQVRVTFSDPMVRLGDARQPAPMTIECSDPHAGAGQGRWSDERTWLYDFGRPLAAGVACTVALAPGVRTLAGDAIEGRTRFDFATGGPSIVSSEPFREARIEEGQHFRLRLNGAVDFASVERAGWCQAAGVGERIPLVVVERDPLARPASTPPATGDPDRYAPPGHSVTVRCQRPLPPGAKVQLVWARGIRSTEGVALTRDQRLPFEVREPFTAQLACQRENAQAPCSPLAPMRLAFSAPVAADLAATVVAQASERRFAPDLGHSAGSVDGVEFAAPFPEQAELVVSLPPGFRDDSGRPLANAGLFPLRVRIAQAPPLLKFAAAPFGIVEWTPDAAVPLTVRRIEAQPGITEATPAASSAAAPAASPGTVSTLATVDDARVIQWLALLERYHDSQIETGRNAQGEPVLRASREVSILPALQAPAGAPRRLSLPASDAASRPFEVVGIPLPEPGFHLIEAESVQLGAALLERRAPMYVRTGVLVTNLAVHLKTAAAGSAVWVTALDTGQPVPDAEVRVSDCTGREAWRGRTDPSGVARVPVALARERADCPPSVGDWFASARRVDAAGRADYAFAMSSWTAGIEPWRFRVNTGTGRPETVAHTVFDRTLLRAGEIVSMKHYVREAVAHGLAMVDAARLPARAVIRHEGSERRFELPLAWHGSRWAESRFAIPRDAPLGAWTVTLEGGPPGGPRTELPSGGFQVAEFRLPVMAGTVSLPPAPLVAPAEVPIDLKIGYLSGGPAAGLPVRLSAGVRRAWPHFEGYETYAFDARNDGSADGADGDEAVGSAGLRLVADRLEARLDANGAARVAVRSLPALAYPIDLVTEATYDDPSGEIQTLSRTTPVWPASIAVGVRTGAWVSQRGSVRVEAVALDAAGRPQPGVPIAVSATASRWLSVRKRLVGGLYAYDSRRETRELGQACEGRTDRDGRFACDAPISGSGEVVLTATARDAQGHAARASTSVWATGAGEVWFDADSADRIDLLPEKREYAPGETARLQVRMPFRHATAWVAIEREGVIETQVVQLSGRDPTVSVPIRAEHAPNVYVSVLAVRGRLREVPWYSLFTWGWKDPTQWWRDRQAAVDWRPPTATVDLAKPAFKLGLAQLKVGTSLHALRVTVTTDRQRYQTRETVKARVRALQPDGKPAAEGTEVAIAAVDEALLELAPNRSWNLLDGLLRERGYGVETATAQMQVIGRRHFGRKAVAAGGGGGRAPTRELFDTLLAWRAAVRLDARGEAEVDIPLNDSLTTFRIVAVADAGPQWFGTGSTTVQAGRDLQIAAGLPPVVRDGDAFTAMATLRNGTDRPMRVRWEASADGQPAQSGVAAIEPSGAQRIDWPVRVPAGPAAIAWTLQARDEGSGAADRVVGSQRVLPAVPVTVQQATLLSLGPEQGQAALPVAPPADALPGRGGIAVRFAPRLADGLDGVRRWLEAYPYDCLEQRASRMLGLRDAAGWAALQQTLASYLDANGLAAFFPVRPDLPDAGSDTLTAYLVSASDELARLDARFALAPALRHRMEEGLARFIEGRLQPRHWAPRRDLDARRLAAIEALSRGGKVRASWLDAIELAPQRWPTSAVIDWAATLARTPQLPHRDEHLRDAEQVLRARLSYQGTRLLWANERDDAWWWLMVNGDVNAARLLAWAVDRPGWKDDLPRLVLGLVGRQVHGAWMTTGANAWGTIATAKFSQAFESEPVSGQSAIAIRADAARAPPASASEKWRAATLDWSGRPAGATLTLPWTSGTLGVAHRGSGRPWATVQALAAVPVREPFAAGYRVVKTIEPVRADASGAAGPMARGDVVRVRLTIEAAADASWVVVDDPIPAGATLLGSGLGRDSQLEARPAADAPTVHGWWPEYEERSFEAYRAYYRFGAAGRFTVQYTMRLNNAGEFHLPATRVEALYNPEMFGVAPNAPFAVAP